MEEFIDYEKIVEETKHYILGISNEEYKSHLPNFRKLTKDLLVDHQGIDFNLLESWKKLLNSKKGRLAFIDSLEENITAGNDKLNKDGYKLITELIFYYLDKVLYHINNRKV